MVGGDWESASRTSRSLCRVRWLAVLKRDAVEDLLRQIARDYRRLEEENTRLWRTLEGFEHRPKESRKASAVIPGDTFAPRTRRHVCDCAFACTAGSPRASRIDTRGMRAHVEEGSGAGRPDRTRAGHVPGRAGGDPGSSDPSCATSCAHRFTRFSGHSSPRMTAICQRSRLSRSRAPAKGTSAHVSFRSGRPGRDLLDVRACSRDERCIDLVEGLNFRTGI